MLYRSPSSANIYVAFEHDDVKIFNVLTKTYQDLNIQEKNQLTILINCFLEKDKEELWIGTDSGLFIYDLFPPERAELLLPFPPLQRILSLERNAFTER